MPGLGKNLLKKIIRQKCICCGNLTRSNPCKLCQALIRLCEKLPKGRLEAVCKYVGEK